MFHQDRGSAGRISTLRTAARLSNRNKQWGSMPASVVKCGIWSKCGSGTTLAIPVLKSTSHQRNAFKAQRFMVVPQFHKARPSVTGLHETNHCRDRSWSGIRGGKRFSVLIHEIAPQSSGSGVLRQPDVERIRLRRFSGTSPKPFELTSSVAFNLEDQPAVGGGSDKFIARDRGWSALRGESSGAVLAARSALTGSNRPVPRARTAAQETVVRRAVASARTLRRERAETLR